MAEQQFNLVFKGELVRGADPVQTKQNMAKLFKISAEKVEALFSGKPMVLKKGLDFETGNKYRVAIKKAGCRVDLIEAAVPAPERNTGKAVFNVPADSSSGSSIKPDIAPSSSGSSLVEGRVQKGSGISMAEVGSDVLAPSERKIIEPLEVDIGALALTESSGDLLADDEKQVFVARDIAPSNISLAEAGAEMLSENEREKVEPVVVELGDISIAPAGADLGQEKNEIKVLRPDISGLSLEP